MLLGSSHCSTSTTPAQGFCIAWHSVSLPLSQCRLEAMKTSDAAIDFVRLFFSFSSFPINVEYFREALCVALPCLAWVGSLWYMGTVRRDHRTSHMNLACLCHVPHAECREKLIKKMPKLRSCLYREIFSSLIRACNTQSNWNKEDENLAQHFILHFQLSHLIPVEKVVSELQSPRFLRSWSSL